MWELQSQRWVRSESGTAFAKSSKVSCSGFATLMLSASEFVPRHAGLQGLWDDRKSISSAEVATANSALVLDLKLRPRLLT